MTVEKTKPDFSAADRRRRGRASDLTSPMVLVRSPAGPIYQFKVRDLSDEGVGAIIKRDSLFLEMIEIGYELKVRVVLPGNYSGTSGHYRARVEHITEIQVGPFSGHIIVGLSFLNKINLDQIHFKGTL